MRQANRIAAGALKMLEERIVPGITTMQMDRWAEEYCRDHGASPAFRGYRGFPGNLCVSVNEVVVHGIASKKVKVAEGDIVSLDFGTLYKGYYGDSAVTVPVGEKPRSDEISSTVSARAFKPKKLAKPVNWVSAPTLSSLTSL